MKVIGTRISIILACIYLVIFFAFTSGIINAIIEGHNYNVNQFLPSRSIQNNYETIIGIFILIFGFIGIMAISKAYNNNKNNEKYIYISTGLIIFSLSIYFMYYLVNQKQ